MKPKYSVVIVKNSNGEFLAVSRKNDTTKFGLPGGHIEEGETPEQAVIRETFEETGLKISNLILICCRQDCECFYTSSFEGEISPSPGETGVVKWTTQEELTCSNSSFPEYNFHAFCSLHLMKGCIHD